MSLLPFIVGCAILLQDGADNCAPLSIYHGRYRMTAARWEVLQGNSRVQLVGSTL